MHRQLHWLDIQSRVRFKIGLLVYKCLHGLPPQYLSDYCVSAPISSTLLTLLSARLQERFLIVPREQEQRQLAPTASFMPHPHFGTRFLTICATLNFPLAVSGTNWKLSFFLKFEFWFFLNLVLLSSTSPIPVRSLRRKYISVHFCRMRRPSRFCTWSPALPSIHFRYRICSILTSHQLSFIRRRHTTPPVWKPKRYISPTILDCRMHQRNNRVVHRQQTQT